MVLSLMPYEDDYQPITKQAVFCNDMFLKILTHESNLEKWSGFVGFLESKIDESEAMRKSVDNIVEDLQKELVNYAK